MKKYVAHNQKSSTFAPAFGRREAGREGSTEAEFFESLRPAQRHPKQGMPTRNQVRNTAAQ